MEQLRIAAEIASLHTIREFVLPHARQRCAEETLADIELALEEIVVNIAEHAYQGSPGDLEISCGPSADAFVIEFCDWGPPFDPLAHPDPDLSLSIEERRIGGLGIYLVKNSTKKICYERRGESNHLRLEYALGGTGDGIPG